MKSLSKSLKGTALGLGLLGSVGASGDVDAGYLYVNTYSADVVNPGVVLAHWPGGLEGLDSIDDEYLSPSIINSSGLDFYAAVNFVNPTDGSPIDRLDTEVRPVDSYTPFHLELGGFGLSSPVSTDLSFNIGDATNFIGKPMWADVSKADGTPVGSYNIWDYSASGDTINLDNITNGHMYNVDVRFTELSGVPIPASAWLFGSGLVGLTCVARRKK